MTRKQMAIIVGLNAVISTVITLLLVLVILPAFDGPAVEVATPTLSPEVAQRATDSAAQPTPTPAPVVHVVESGDTISGLALRYDVPEEDIIAANNLQNPNILQVGTELIIPIGGLPEVTATFTPAPTPTETEMPFDPPSAQTATAVAQASATVQPSPTLLTTGELQVEITGITAPGEVDRESVVITNEGQRLADMTGWTLSDADGNVYVFPNFRLWGNGSSVTVHTRIGQDGNPTGNFFWGKLEAIWSPGETATLSDADGEVVATYSVGP